MTEKKRKEPGGVSRRALPCRGVSTDSVEASAKAFLNAINRIASVANGTRRPDDNG